MELLILVLIPALLAFLLRYRLGSWKHPVVVYVLTCVGVFAFTLANPLRIAVPGLEASAILALGTAAIAIGAALAPRGSSRGAHSQYRTSYVSAVIALVGLGVVLLYGVLSIRTSIEVAAGTSLENLSAVDVRRLTVYGDARTPGVQALGFLVAPLVGAMGLLLTQRYKWAWLAVPLSVAATTVTPARTYTLTTIALLVVFWLLIRTSKDQATASLGRDRTRIATVLALGVLAFVGYFGYVGAELDKNEYFASQVGDTAVPSAGVPLVVYLTASPATLSSALENDLTPTYGSPGRSVWLFPRIAATLDPSVQVPDTIAGFSPIPFPFNTYTWAGDVYFDFGLPGVIFIGLTTGFGAVIVIRRASQLRSPASAWIAAVYIVFLFSSLIQYRFFLLESLVWFVGGGLLFFACARAGLGASQPDG